MLGIVIERDVFSLLLQLNLRCRREPLRERGLAVELMRKPARLHHGLRVKASGMRKSRIDGERRRSGLLARVIGECQQPLFGLKIFMINWDIGSSSRCRS